MARLADFVLHEIMVPGDTLVSAGVASHLTDLLLPELSKCVAEGGAAAPSDITLHALLDPFCQALAATTNPALIYRLRWDCSWGEQQGKTGRALVSARLAPPARLLALPMMPLPPPPPTVCFLLQAGRVQPAGGGGGAGWGGRRAAAAGCGGAGGAHVCAG